MRHFFLTLFISIISSTLIGCGGGSSSAESPAEQSEATTQNTTQSNGLSNCLISRFDLNPSSGTISKSRTSLRADADIQLPSGTTDFTISAIIRDENDSFKEALTIINSGVEKSINGTTGRAFVAFNLRDGNFSPITQVRYTDLFVAATITKADGSTSRCELERTVDLFLVD